MTSTGQITYVELCDGGGDGGRVRLFVVSTTATENGTLTNLRGYPVEGGEEETNIKVWRVTVIG